MFVSLGLPLCAFAADDAVPVEVQLWVDEARRALSSHNRSVSAAVLYWDEHLAAGDEPSPMDVYVRRRSVVIEHVSPLRKAALPGRCLRLRLTAASTIHLAQGESLHQTRDELVRELRAITVPGGALGSADVELSAAWKDVADGLLPLRPNHVRRAFARPSAFAVHDVGSPAAIVTRHVTTGKRELVLVLYARRFEGTDRWIVELGLQLFDEPAVLRRLAGDPNEAFAEAPVRYGNPFRVAGRQVWWATSLRVQLPPGTSPTAELLEQLAAAVGVTEAPETCLMPATTYITEDMVFAVWGLYWIHLDRYRAALVEASRARS